MRTPAVAAAAAICTLLSGCGLRDDFAALLPDEHGLYGAVTFQPLSGAAAKLTDPGKAMTIDSDQPGEIAILPGQMQQVLADQHIPEPIPPATFEFLFLLDSDTMTDASKKKFRTAAEEIYRQVQANIRSRKAAEVLVEGYTDTTGTWQHNDELSQERATAIKRDLYEFGIKDATITAVGRGERNLAISTGQGVNEPQNRRADITVL